MLDKLNEECGVFGISLKNSSSELINNMYLGIFSLQHRGQESCGIAYSNETIHLIKSKGLVAGDFFEMLPARTSSSTAIGHVRYSTCGSSNLTNAQPFIFSCNKGDIAIAHNGNIPNSGLIKNELISSGSIFQTTSDSEILVHLISRIPYNDFETSLISALNQLNGAYSMLIMHEDTLVAIRDPNGFKPLCYGEIEQGYVFASETNALDILNASNYQEVQPGEIIFCKKGKIEKKNFKTSPKISQCIFELIYFARPDSIIFKEGVHDFRIKTGRKLAQSRKFDTDIVIPVPDSGNSAALGFAMEAGIPFEYGLIRNHYTGRTFIRPEQKKRAQSVKIKLNPVKSVIHGKKIAVIDDSLVRGTTSGKIVKMLKESGAREVHMYLSSPEIKYSCHFGIDIPTREELISSQNTPQDIARLIGADSVTFLKIEDLKDCIKETNNFCFACYNGQYPIKINQKSNQK